MMIMYVSCQVRVGAAAARIHGSSDSYC